MPSAHDIFPQNPQLKQTCNTAIYKSRILYYCNQANFKQQWSNIRIERIAGK